MKKIILGHAETIIGLDKAGTTVYILRNNKADMEIGEHHPERGPVDPDNPNILAAIQIDKAEGAYVLMRYLGYAAGYAAEYAMKSDAPVEQREESLAELLDGGVRDSDEEMYE